METSLPILSLSAAALAGAAAAFPKIQARIALSRAKHRSLTGHSKMSKMVARMVPKYEFDIDAFFCSDGAPKDIAMQRQVKQSEPKLAHLIVGCAEIAGRAHFLQ